jgi:phosphoribosylamine--glycine ligase
MKILVVGSGGREHALAWRLARENIDVLVAPGNAGTPRVAAIAATDLEALVALAERERVDLTIVGPEAPLAAGLVDRFASAGLKAFGPTRTAARLEWSKGWTKDFLARHAIPTAPAEIVDSEAGARRAVGRVGLPIALKADGLAGGKGVFVAVNEADVEAALDQLFRRRTLGAAADYVLVEEYQEGPELSVLAFTDGERLAVMPPVRDYKRLLDGDRGPNTGGMGGYARPAYATPSLLDEIEQRILRPALAGMQAEGHPYRGVLYAGLMLTRFGPKVLEFNCRFGDPECQLVLPLLDSSLADMCSAVVSGWLEPDEVRWADGRTYGVVLATRGYPEAAEAGQPLAGVDDLPEEVFAFHGSTCRDGDRAVTAGGRALTLVGFDRTAVYAAAEAVKFEGKQFRRDIGLEADPFSPPAPLSHRESGEVSPREASHPGHLPRPGSSEATASGDTWLPPTRRERSQ